MAQNHTVKLSVALEARINSAMERLGYSVWAEFCRVALTEKCAAAEAGVIKKPTSK